MAIRINHRGSMIVCDSASEAIEILKHIEAEENAKPGVRGPFEGITKLLGQQDPWSGQLFFRFIDSLGDAQIEVLSLLKEKEYKLADADLRKALKLNSNQQLAGVLSGISKQAAALGVKARDVYVSETEFAGGSATRRLYYLAPVFRAIAEEMNWPEG